MENTGKHSRDFLDGVLVGIALVEAYDEGRNNEVDAAVAKAHDQFDRWEQEFIAENKVEYIIINGRYIKDPPNPVSYQQIVDLADSGRSKECLHTITYCDGPSENREGTLSPKSKPVLLKNGMNFGAYVTDGA